MIKKIHFGCCLLFFFGSITVMTSQSGGGFLEINYNTFSHRSLKSFQTEFKMDLPEVPIQTTDNFPSFFGFTLGYHLEDINTDFWLSYSTTGGKLSYADFSGSIVLTQPLNGYTLGGTYHLLLVEKNKQYLTLGLRGMGYYSRFTVNSVVNINQGNNEEQLKFNAIDLGVGVSIIYQYPISFFYVRASLGFDVVLGGKLLFAEDSELFLENNAGDAVRTGWSGLRTGIGLLVPF